MVIIMNYGYNNELIPSVLSAKFLWLTVDGMFSWRMYINHVIAKCSTVCVVDTFSHLCIITDASVV
jgi:hypothetical protein